MGVPRRFEALDSLRGVAAVTVALGHMQTQGRIATSAFVLNGYMLVDFFFVLSGFVIAASYRERLAAGFSWRKFMALRLGRLYPLHLFLLTLLLLFELAHAIAGTIGRPPFTGGNTPGLFVANLLLLQTFAGPEALSWNGPSWSIAVEFWTYALFGLVFAHGRRAVVPAALLIAAGGWLWMARVSPRGINLFHAGAFARCLFGFGLGVATHAAFLRMRSPRIAAGTAAELAVCVVAVTVLSLASPDRWSLAVPLVFPPLLLVFAHEAGAVSRLLRSRPAALLGLLSYSIYMIHQLLWFRMLNLAHAIDRLTRHRLALIDPHDDHRLGGGPWLGDAVSVAMILMLVVVAMLSYRWIEAPGMRWSRRRVLGAASAGLAAERQAPTF